MRRVVTGTSAELVEKPIETRFVLWFNGNGIPERYWIPTEEGRDYELTPCLAPLAAWRKDVHVLSGVDNAAASGKGQRPYELDERLDDRHWILPAADPAVLRSTRSLRRRSAAIRGSARCRSAWRRNLSARACSAT